MLKLKLYKDDNEIKKLYKIHFGSKLETDDKNMIYGLYDDDKLVAYMIYNLLNHKTVKIDWIYAPGYGKVFMKRMESKFRKDKINKILLNVSIDPKENKNTVMKRINYYVSLRYKVYDIKFRKINGPLLYMEKLL
jgi:hypothetical protein